MKQIEIRREQWPAFADAFSAEHHEWLVTVARAATTDLEAAPHSWPQRWQILYEDMPLEELGLTETDGHVQGRVRLRSDHAPVSETLEDVRRVIRVRTDDRHVGLRMDGQGRRSLLVWFRVAAAPAELDGIMASEV